MSFNVHIPIVIVSVGVGFILGLWDCVGDTPLCKLQSLSNVLNVEVFVKLEFLNPGGTSKDRAAKMIIKDAEEEGLLKKGSVIMEGSAGSTGISLTMLGSAHGYSTHMFLPSDMALEKTQLLETLGAKVERVPPAPFCDPEHYCNIAQRTAEENNGFFANQFENLSNFKAHYTTTAVEIWNEMNKDIDYVVLGAGTGGMIAGVSSFLKEKDEGIKIILIDPPGSSLHNKVNGDVAFSKTESEGTRKRRQVDTIVEGIGIVGRVTTNFSKANIDSSLKCTDQECIDMSRYILKHEGFFIGSSSAANLVGVVKVARDVQRGSKIVTLLCDSGYRHISKFWNNEFLKSKGFIVERTFELQNDLSFIQ